MNISHQKIEFGKYKIIVNSGSHIINFNNMTKTFLKGTIGFIIIDNTMINSATKNKFNVKFSEYVCHLYYTEFLILDEIDKLFAKMGYSVE